MTLKIDREMHRDLVDRVDESSHESSRVEST